MANMIRSISIILLLFAVVFPEVNAYDLVVDQNQQGDFTSISAALHAAPIRSDTPFTIYIKNGFYQEKLVIPAEKTNIVLVSESRDQVILSYDDHSGKGDINTFTSYTVKVAGNGFQAHDLTIQNTAGFTAGQAVALHLESDLVVISNCRILGHQDTLFADGTSSRQYFTNCNIEGTTDFIFGSSTACFENCHIHSKKDSHVTAASTSENQEFGYVFYQCRLTAEPGLENVSLGRPWRLFAAVAYLECEIGSHIKAEGWHNWSKPEREATVRYLDYGTMDLELTVQGR